MSRLIIVPAFVAFMLALPAGAAELVPLSQVTGQIAACENCMDIKGLTTGSKCADFQPPNEYKPKEPEMAEFKATYKGLYLVSQQYQRFRSYLFNSAPRDVLETFCTSPLSGNLIYELGRVIDYRNTPNRPQASQLVSDIRAKYGVPQFVLAAPYGSLLQFGVSATGHAVPDFENQIDWYQQPTLKKLAAARDDQGLRQLLTVTTSFCQNDPERVCRVVFSMLDVAIAADGMSANEKFQSELNKAVQLTYEERRKGTIAPAPDL